MFAILFLVTRSNWHRLSRLGAVIFRSNKAGTGASRSGLRVRDALDPLHLDSLNCSWLDLQTELPFHPSMIDRLCCSQTDADVFYDTPVGLSPFDPDYTLENPNGIRDFAAIDHLSLMLWFQEMRRQRAGDSRLRNPPPEKSNINSL